MTGSPRFDAADDDGALLTVLLAEDFQDSRDLYRFFLEGRGWRVVDVADGGEVLAAVAQEDPDVIVMDLSLPTVDGWTLTRQLRTARSTAHIPVLVLSAHVLPEERERAFAAGCTGFLAKPCLPEHMERELRRLVGQPVPAKADAQ
jgi:CheY-like chemotaxis protein